MNTVILDPTIQQASTPFIAPNSSLQNDWSIPKI